MKQPQSIDTTFKAMRQLPLEVSLNQVKAWIKNAPSTPSHKSRWSYFKWIFPFGNN